MTININAMKKAAEALGLTIQEKRSQPHHVELPRRGYVNTYRVDITMRKNKTLILYVDNQTDHVVSVDYLKIVDNPNDPLYPSFRYNIGSEHIKTVSSLLKFCINGTVISEASTERSTTLFISFSRGKINRLWVKKKTDTGLNLIAIAPNDGVVLEWIGDKITDGMLLDYIYDLLNWKE